MLLPSSCGQKSKSHMAITPNKVKVKSVHNRKRSTAKNDQSKRSVLIAYDSSGYRIILESNFLNNEFHFILLIINYDCEFCFNLVLTTNHTCAVY